MKNQKIIEVIVIVLVVAGLSFLGGMKYANSKSPVNQFTNRAQNGTTRTGTGTEMRGGANGGFVSGQVLSMDAKSMTIKLNSGGSKIVFYSPTTTIEKTVSGTPTDVAVDKQVTIVGTTNSDGSINATSIQLRPDFANNIPPVKQ